MNARLPAPDEIDELLSFLPRLYAPGFDPIRKWHGTARDQAPGVMPWPEYEQAVEEFVHAASRDCWNDPDYDPEQASRMLRNPGYVRTADLPDIRTMLTYCIRGERFCPGFWAGMIKEGHIRRILERLAEWRARKSDAAPEAGAR